jgi:phosphate transport system substrate-binding protein
LERHVAASNGAITYVETAYAYLHDKPCAYVENASDHYVIPTELNDAVALEGAELLPDLEQKLDGVYTNPLPDTYPISAYS